MAGRTETRTGYLIRSIPYSDNSSLLWLLTPDGGVFFGARGIEKPTGKGHFLTFPLVECEVVLSLSTDGKRRSFKEGRPLALPDLKDDLARGVSYSLVREAVSSLVRESDEAKAYGLLSAYMGAMERGEDALTAGAAFLAELTAAIGYGLEVDGCLRCGKREQIAALSFKLGGFLCAEHAHGHARPGASFLKAVRYLNKLPLNEKFPLAIDVSTCKRIIRGYVGHLECLTGVKLKSVDLLKAF